MTDKQRKFADEYIIDCNATRAYKAAYPNVKKDAAAAVNASKLLRNAKVFKYIDEKPKEISSAKIAKVQEVMEYLTSVMWGRDSRKWSLRKARETAVLRRASWRRKLAGAIR